MLQANFVNASTMTQLYGFPAQLLALWARKGILPGECWKPSSGGKHFYYNPEACIRALPGVIDKYRRTLNSEANPL